MGDPILQMAPALPGFEAAMDPLTEAQLRSDEARRIFELNAEAEPGMDDYWALLAEGWDWRQAAYMVWEAQPAANRKPKTQFELATQVLGLTSDRVISQWKRDNPAVDARIAKLTVSALVRSRAEIIAALIEVASMREPRAHPDRRMCLEMLGDYVPKQKMILDASTPLEQVDTPDLAAMAQLPEPDAAEGVDVEESDVQE